MRLTSLFYKVPYHPTRLADLEAIFSNIDIHPNNTFVDVGSGDGRVLRYVKLNFECQCIGYEPNATYRVYSRILNFLSNLDIEIRKGRAENISLKDVDIVYAFLLPKVLTTLGKRIDKYADKNTILISHAFVLPQYEKKLVHTIESKPFSTYIYKF